MSSCSSRRAIADYIASSPHRLGGNAHRLVGPAPGRAVPGTTRIVYVSLCRHVGVFLVRDRRVFLLPQGPRRDQRPFTAINVAIDRAGGRSPSSIPHLDVLS